MNAIELVGNTIIMHSIITPKSSKDEIIGLLGNEVKISITAPPIDGKANTYICKYLGKLFKTAKSNVKILKGENNKHKTIEISHIQELPEKVKLLISQK
jgi:uncharacterized protein